MKVQLKPWDKCDSFLLFGLVASIVTLICTCTLVWNPYLETDTFYWGNCVVTHISPIVMQTCKGQGACYTPTVTVPPGWSNITAISRTSTATTTITTIATAATASTIGSSTTISTPSNLASSTPSTPAPSPSIPTITPSSSSIGTSTEKSRRRKRETEEECVMFPCFQVKVAFRNPYVSSLASAWMWDHYSDMINYPQCSVSSCDSDNTDNLDNVQSFYQQMAHNFLDDSTFTCYLNYNNYSQILYHVNGSYPAALNSIFWPIIGLIGFFIGFIVYRFTGSHGRSSRPPPPSYDASYGVGGPSTGPVVFVDVGLGRVPGNDYVIGGAAGGHPVASMPGEKNSATLGTEIGERGVSPALPSQPHSFSVDDVYGFDKY